jgi:hypothetical protein
MTALITSSCALATTAVGRRLLHPLLPGPSACRHHAPPSYKPRPPLGMLQWSPTAAGCASELCGRSKACRSYLRNHKAIVRQQHILQTKALPNNSLLRLRSVAASHVVHGKKHCMLLMPGLTHHAASKCFANRPLATACIDSCLLAEHSASSIAMPNSLYSMHGSFAVGMMPRRRHEFIFCDWWQLPPCTQLQ